MSGVIKRFLSLGHPSFLKGFTGRELIESYVLLASSVSGEGVDEVQSATITGTPTGGTFTLTFGGNTTSAIAYNAGASAVEDALEALASIGDGNVGVSGSAGGPYTVTFKNDLGSENVAALTASGAGFTGGTSPGVTIATVTVGADSVDGGRLWFRAGTPVKEAPGDNTKVVPYDGSGTIIGVGGLDHEFIDSSAESDCDLPVYLHSAVFDKSKIVGYTANAAALDTWAETHACQFRD